ncbi:hypothetical protein F4824DRAFT_460700 [Ustulina deusta]|nr:hypothetical protein F4824DRAFT_460700 [Ustulina deusta]
MDYCTASDAPQTQDATSVQIFFFLNLTLTCPPLYFLRAHLPRIKDAYMYIAFKTCLFWYLSRFILTLVKTPRCSFKKRIPSAKREPRPTCSGGNLILG